MFFRESTTGVASKRIAAAATSRLQNYLASAKSAMNRRSYISSRRRFIFIHHFARWRKLSRPTLKFIGSTSMKIGVQESASCEEGA